MVIPKPPKASSVTGIPISRSKKTVATAAHSSGLSPLLPAEVASSAATFVGGGVMPLPLASILAIASLPELVREFGQIKTKLRSPRRPSEPQTLQDSHQVFREQM